MQKPPNAMAAAVKLVNVEVYPLAGTTRSCCKSPTNNAARAEKSALIGSHLQAGDVYSQFAKPAPEPVIWPIE